MNLNLEGKTALITGSAAGIGLTLHLSFMNMVVRLGLILEMRNH